MARRHGVVAAIALALTLVAAVAWAQPADDAGRRVALVIGNDGYAHTRALRNAGTDARDIAAALRRIGFEVTVATDQSRRDIERALVAFSRQAEGAAVALFYYAGHGIQAAGVNYLLPVDGQPRDERDLRAEAIDLREVLEAVADAQFRMIVLDACRNNPLADNMRARGRSVGRGLARIDVATPSTLIVFSAAPGAEAEDGPGPNSPFAGALLAHLETRGLEVQQLMTRVTRSTQEATRGQQTPEVTARGLGREVFLAPAPATTATAAQAAPAPAAAFPAFDPRALDLAFWSSIQASSNAADYQEYLRRFPDGTFAGLARNRLAALRPAPARPAPATATPPVATPPAATGAATTPAATATATTPGPTTPAPTTPAPATPAPATPATAPPTAAPAAATPPSPTPPAAATAIAAPQAPPPAAAPAPVRPPPAAPAAMPAAPPPAATTAAVTPTAAPPPATTAPAPPPARLPAASPPAAPAPLQACDQLAAPRLLPGTPGPGIDLDAMDGAAAVAACQAAIAAFPNERRFRAYLARAQYRSGAHAAAVAAAQPEAESGDALALQMLGVMTRDGQGGLRRDNVRALQLLRRAADAGYAVAQADLAFMIADSRGTPREQQEVLRLLRAAAESGEPRAQNSLGLAYQDGRGIARDDREAVRWFRAAAEQGHVGGQLNLGAATARGRGTARNEEEAQRIYAAIAERGDPRGWRELATLYRSATQLPRNYRGALLLLRFAMERNEAESFNIYALMLRGGEGIARDDAEAVRYFRIAMERGSRWGTYNLGGMYETGRGVPANRDEAIRLYRLAADQWVPEAADALRRLGAAPAPAEAAPAAARPPAARRTAPSAPAAAAPAATTPPPAATR